MIKLVYLRFGFTMSLRSWSQGVKGVSGSWFGVRDIDVTSLVMLAGMAFNKDYSVCSVNREIVQGGLRSALAQTLQSYFLNLKT